MYKVKVERMKRNQILTITVRCLYITLNKLRIQTIKNKDDFNNLMYELDLTDILRTLHLTMTEYTLYLSAYRILMKADHILGHKAE